MARQRREVSYWCQAVDPFQDLLRGLLRSSGSYALQPRRFRGSAHLEPVMQQLRKPFTPLLTFPVQYHLLPALAKSGLLRPIDAAINAKTRQQYCSEALLLCTVDEKLYAVPDDIWACVMLVKPQDLNAFGLRLAQTWKELEAQAVRIKPYLKQPPISVYGSRGGGNRIGFLCGLLGSNGLDPSAGPAELKKDADRVAQAFAWVQSLVDRGLLEFYSGNPPGQQDDISRKWLYSFSWSGRANKLLKHDLKDVMYGDFPAGPGLDGSPRSRPYHGWAWCVPHNTVALDIAFEFISRIASFKHTKYRELSGGTAFPAMKALWKNAEVLDRRPHYTAATRLIDSPRPYASCGLIPVYADLDKRFHDALRRSIPVGELVSKWSRDATKNAGASPRNALLQRAIDYVEAHLSTVRSVAEIAGVTRRSGDHLNRLFRQHTGLTCWEYVIKRRMETARELLKDCTVSIKEIAARTGCASPSYFSQAFKRHWNCSAVDMRRRLLGM